MIFNINLNLTIQQESDGSFTVVKSSIIKDKPVAAPVIKDEGSEPQLILESNKYGFNKAAADLMGLNPDDRISIKYQKINGVLFPVIGKDEAFGTGGGNKLTKSFTVSCRGNANEKLSTYGDIFEITKMKDKDGLFVLVGNAEMPEIVETDEVIIKEDENDDFDLPLDTTISDESAYEIDDLAFDV